MSQVAVARSRSRQRGAGEPVRNAGEDHDNTLKKHQNASRSLFDGSFFGCNLSRSRGQVLKQIRGPYVATLVGR
jgi:hypothetical protein